MAENENFVFLFYLYYILFIVYSAMLNSLKLQTFIKRGGRCSELALSKCSYNYILTFDSHFI